MDNQALLQMFQFSRSNTLASLNATTEEQALIVPQGFNNSILWNLGHIYVAVESVMSHVEGSQAELPESYSELFGIRTSPSAWTINPPTLEELASYLEEQIKYVESTYGDKLEEKLTEPFQLNDRTTFHTYGEVLNFMIWHEGLHLGVINGIKRAIGISELWKPLEVKSTK